MSELEKIQKQLAAILAKYPPPAVVPYEESLLITHSLMFELVSTVIQLEKAVYGEH